ncbi:hypothetical protein ES702_04492 [subsurface metagenome]
MSISLNVQDPKSTRLAKLLHAIADYISDSGKVTWSFDLSARVIKTKE